MKRAFKIFVNKKIKLNLHRKVNFPFDIRKTS